MDTGNRLIWITWVLSIVAAALALVRLGVHLRADRSAHPERRRAHAELIDGIPVAVAILELTDPADPRSLVVIDGNPAAIALFRPATEMGPRPVPGARLIDLLPSSAPLLGPLAEVVRRGQPMARPAVRLRGGDSLHALRAVPLPGGRVGVTLEDVTTQVLHTESLRHRALHDHLTGLANRALLEQRLRDALDRSRRSDARTALVLVDLDRFKEVNDSLGHEFGDRLLAALGQRLAARLRGCDVIARLGGDEFAVLVTEVPDLHSALGVAGRLAELCCEPFELDGGFRLQVGASVGVAVAPDHATDAESLSRAADAAMYRAKESGGGVVLHSTGALEAGGARHELVAELAALLAGETDPQVGRLVLHYQPRLALRVRPLVPLGVEALVRWEHPRLGLLPPAEFVELAEVSGTIDALTRTVIRRADDELATLELPAGFVVAVNLSARCLAAADLEHWIATTTTHGRLRSGWLCLEVNERQLTDDPDRTRTVLERLHALGIHLAVDDFGSGEASMAFLRHLPLDMVKIDPALVADLEQGDDRMVRTAIDLGHNLGLHVVAEGVEHGRSLQRLVELGCDSAQGHHLGSPMPVHELARHLGGQLGGRIRSET